MVQNPYGDEGTSGDARRLKLQLQAQEQFIQQLQQRIAKQSMKIEELQTQIQQLQQIIAEKDVELERYSKRLEEERRYWEEDKKARTNKEHELMKTIKEKEMEIRRLKEAVDGIKKETSLKKNAMTDSTINKFLRVMLAFYRKPTEGGFVDSLKDLLKFVSEHGTLEQKILGVLNHTDLPMKLDEIAAKVGAEPYEVNVALQGLLREELVKSVGKGYVLISSDYAGQSASEIDFSTSSAKEILDQLRSIVYIAENNNELVLAFTKARDRLMEMGVLSPLTRHAISQQINRIKSGNYDPAELQKMIKTWKDQIK